LGHIRRNPNNPRVLQAGQEDIEALREQASATAGTGPGAEPSDEYFDALSHAIDQTAPDADRRDALEKIFLLAKSINKLGLIQPISVFDDGGREYTIMAGERRFLAHIMLGRPTIRALVRERQGDEVEDRLGSLVENIAREDLTTSEKIRHIATLVSMHEARPPGEPMSAELLHGLIHESIRSCYRYLKIIRSPSVTLEKIHSGDLSTVREIEEHLRTHVSARRGADPAGEPGSPGSPGNGPEQAAETDAPPPANWETATVKRKGRGRERRQINLGRTDNALLVKSILTAWHGKSKMDALYGAVDWGNLNAVQKVWSEFLHTAGKKAPT
jgi:hypothetical protein